MSEQLPIPEAAERPCPRCKALRLVLRCNDAHAKRHALSYARAFQPAPHHVTSCAGPHFVTGVLCESLVLGAGRVIQGGRA